MSDTNPNRNELKRTVRMLREITELASHASLSGSLQGGAPRARQQFNAILSRLEQAGEISPGFFTPLADNVSFDETGVVASQLAAYIDDPEPEGRSHPVAPNIMFNGPIGQFDAEQLKELGKIVRENMTDWFKAQEASAAEASAEKEQTRPQEASAPDFRPPPPAPPVVAIPSPPAHPAQFIPDAQGVRIN